MQVRVLFFGMLRDLVGQASDSIQLPEGAMVSDLLAYCSTKNPRMRDYLPSLATSINQEYVAPSAVLHDQDEVGLLPPVSGGAPESQAEASIQTNMRAFLLHTPIDTRRVIEGIKHAQDGAVVAFEGVVRDNSRGRRTLYLDYEAYEPMALKRMEELAAQAVSKFQVRDVVIVHRLGRLQIGETSVLIVVASAHRASGFEACRWAIETLKQTVPIWKKEYFADGALWADGEPFPSDISGAAIPSKDGGGI